MGDDTIAVPAPTTGTRDRPAVARGSGARGAADPRASSRSYPAATARTYAAITAPRADRIARVALPIACAAAWWVIAAYHRDPPVAAEARYLGFLAAAILLAALHATPRISTSLGSACILLGAVPWALPGTPDRGAATGVLLAAILAIAAASGWMEPASRRPKLAALMIGAQLLARGGDLLAPTTASVIGAVAWTCVATAALVSIQKQRGVLAAALAGTAAFLLGPGFTPMSALALAVPALGSIAADRDRAVAWRVAAAAAVMVPLAWDFERGALLVAGAIAVAAPAWARWTAGLAGLVAFFAPGADRAAGLEAPAWLLVLLPIVASELRSEPATRFAAIGLALGAAAQITDSAALALPAVVLAATVAGTRPLAAATQVAWTGVLATTVAILAAYPWLRPDALRDATAILGLGAGWRAALWTLVLFGVAALASRLVAGRSREAAPLAPRAIALLLVPLALSYHSASSAVPISRQAVKLDARTPTWSAPIEPPARVSALRLDTTLSHAAELAPGTVIAEVVLATGAGERVVPVRAGVDTGEWAARRPDVAAIPGFAAPEPFLHWVDAGGRFFGQRYRARPRLDAAATATAIEVRLVPGAPADLELTVFHLELSR